ncbi:hypothetical protein ACP4OV_027033 [Aristida adscensionis]
MEDLIKLFNDWEIQMLVVLSFTLQVFLFFTGGLRQQRTKLFLRFSIWMAYLGADLVAVYALGYLSRHTDATVGCGTLGRTHPLAFFWAPFLLIHLGGQDTITAFSMEDNNLWLRHLLNMMVQIVLATYIFWKSIGRQCGSSISDEALSLVDIELGIVYNDLYTKSVVTRTKSGIMFRCISQVAAVVAFMMFLAADRQGYSRTDIAITYSLFIGGYFLEVCAVLNFLKSPWTWAWFKVQRCDLLAWLSWCLFNNDTIGWRKPAGSIVMGQYNLMFPSEKPRLLSRYLMTMVKKLVRFFGVQEEKIFWLSKLLFTEYAEAEGTMQILLSECYRLDYRRLPLDHQYARCTRSEAHLRKHYSQMNDAASANVKSMVQVCQQLSQYMVYLLVTHPSLLPLCQSAAALLETWMKMESLDRDRARQETRDLPSGVETLEVLQKWWRHVVAYAAGKSRPEIHAPLLARGGEPLTFVWLLLAHLQYDRMPALFAYRGLQMSDLLGLQQRMDSGPRNMIDLVRGRRFTVYRND